MDLDSDSRNDPYKIWVAAVIFLHTIYDNDEAKAMATSVEFGDEEEGEEVVTAIQTMAANLITCLEHNHDPRISLAYLMVLCTWLYEDTTAVDDFLQEGATVQTLVAAVTKSTNSNSLVQGLCTFLLGILYEFSTTESPVPRATLHTILVSRLGRDQYVNRLTRLRENSIVRDFEVTAQTHNGKRGLPDIFFNHIFIDFLKDNYSRIFRTIDKDPGQKTHYKLGSDGTPNGISLELVDSLKAQIVDKEDSLGKLQTTNMDLEKKLIQEQQDFKKFKETSAAEIAKYHDQAEALKRHYETNAAQGEEHFKATVLRLENRVARVQQEGEGQIKELEADLARVRKDAEEAIKRQKAQGDMEAKRTKDAWEADARRLRQEKDTELRKMDESYRREMAKIKSEGDALVQRITTESRGELQRARADFDRELKKLGEKAEAGIRQVEEQARAVLQTTKDQKDAVITMLEGRVNDLEADLESSAKEFRATRGRHEEELIAVKKFSDENAEANEKARKALEQKLSAVQAEEDVKLKKLEERLKQAEQEKKAVEEKLKTALDKAQAEREKLKAAQTEAEGRATKAESKVIEVKNAADEEIRKAQEAAEEKLNKAREAANEESEKRRDELERKLAELQELLNKSKALVDESVKKEKAATEKLKQAQEDAQVKISAVEETAKNIQAELDDLLLVLGDIEDKKKAYKVGDKIIPVISGFSRGVTHVGLHTTETTKIFERDGVG